MQVRISARALADIVAIQAYLTNINPRVARDTTLRLIAAIDSLSAFPNRGRHGLKTGTRELTSVPRYVVVYIVGDAVEVARVWHVAQDRA